MPDQNPRPSEYVSTDPNFGLTPDSPEYVSTDPNFGLTPQGQAPKAPATEQGQSGLAGVATGAMKGAANTFIGLGQLFSHLPGVKQASEAVQREVDRLYGGTGVAIPTDQALAAAKQEYATPQGTAEKVGYGAEQIGEFFVPAGAANATATKVAAKAARLLSKAPRVVRGAASFAPRMATEAATTAGVTAAQGGDPASGAVVGAAGPVVGKSANALGSHLKTAALKGVVKALGPTKERYKAIAEKLAPEFLERRVGGWTGTSLKTLRSEASAEAAKAGKAVDAALAQHGSEQVPGQLLHDGLERAKKAFVSPDTGVVLDERVVGHLTKLQELLARLGPNPSVRDVVATRRAWDHVVSQAGGYEQRAAGGIGVPLMEKSEAWAKREGAKAIREVLNQAVPDMKAVNAEYHFWKGITDVVGQTLKREAPQRAGVGRTILTASGMLAGASSGDSPMDKAEKMLIYGTVANRMAAAFRSPQWRLISANLKNELADALAARSVGQATSVLFRIEKALGAAAKGGVSLATR